MVIHAFQRFLFKIKSQEEKWLLSTKYIAKKYHFRKTCSLPQKTVLIFAFEALSKTL